MLDEWEITEKIHIAVRDNSSNQHQSIDIGELEKQLRDDLQIWEEKFALSQTRFNRKN